MTKTITIKFENAQQAVPINADITIDLNEVPALGTLGFVLTKTETGYEFAAIPLQLPAVSELANGDYKLHIVDGVATWVVIA